jgi:predicted GIY-YIG superfamily endonuclease
MDEKRPLIATYIEASRPFGVLYIGMTNNLYRRGGEHRAGGAEGSRSATGATSSSGISRSSALPAPFAARRR